MEAQLHAIWVIRSDLRYRGIDVVMYQGPRPHHGIQFGRWVGDSRKAFVGGGLFTIDRSESWARFVAHWNRVAVSAGSQLCAGVDERISWDSSASCGDSSYSVGRYVSAQNDLCKNLTFYK